MFVDPSKFDPNIQTDEWFDKRYIGVFSDSNEIRRVFYKTIIRDDDVRFGLHTSYDNIYLYIRKGSEHINNLSLLYIDNDDYISGINTKCLVRWLSPRLEGIIRNTHLEYIRKNAISCEILFKQITDNLGDIR